MRTEGFRASVDRDNGITVVRLSGEIDLATAPRLGELLGSCRGPTVVDCAALTFLDSSALAILAKAHRSNPTLTLRRLPRQCRRVVDIAGLTRLVALEER